MLFSDEAAAMQLQLQAAMADPLFSNPQISNSKQRHYVHATALSSHLMPLNSQIHHREKIEVCFQNNMVEKQLVAK